MAWDTEATRRRLKEAATAEFAERGLEGTTMTRIAERAGINKERLYSYFGDKQALWGVVLADAMERLASAVSLNGAGLEDVGEYAAAVYDYHAEHPELARLLQWEGLGRAPAADAGSRSVHYRDKVERFSAAQREGLLDGGIEAAHLVFALIALAAWWQTVPQLAQMITGTDGGDADERDRRRTFVVEAARRLATPR